MTHFIELKKSWEDNKKGDIVEVGKSTAHALVKSKKGIRASDPFKFPPAIKDKPKRGRPPKKKFWGA